ncbi:MAG: hypothetical protein ACJ75G_02215 [Gaiellaceae bacterium]
MRRLLGWIGGAVGGVATYRWLRRPRAEPEVVAEPDDRAEELRAKLAESHAAEPVAEERSAEPVAEEEPAAEPESPAERRRRVHEEGRAALDEMQSE